MPMVNLTGALLDVCIELESNVVSLSGKLSSSDLQMPVLILSRALLNVSGEPDCSQMAVVNLNQALLNACGRLDSNIAGCEQ